MLRELESLEYVRSITFAAYPYNKINAHVQTYLKKFHSRDGMVDRFYGNLVLTSTQTLETLILR